MLAYNQSDMSPAINSVLEEEAEGRSSWSSARLSFDSTANCLRLGSSGISGSKIRSRPRRAKPGLANYALSLSAGEPTFAILESATTTGLIRSSFKTLTPRREPRLVDLAPSPRAALLRMVFPPCSSSGRPDAPSGDAGRRRPKLYPDMRCALPATASTRDCSRSVRRRNRR